MTIETATRIIRDCVSQDIGNEGSESILDADADVCIANWRKYSAEAGDLDTVAAIELLGSDKSAEVYERELIRIEELASQPHRSLASLA